MNPPAKLSELLDCLEFESELTAYYFDRKTGEVVAVDRSLLSALEEEDEDTAADLSEWGKKEIDLARAIFDEEGVGERFIQPPDKNDFHEYRQMERFIATVTSSRAAEELYRAIKGKGAFRYFKDTLDRLGLREQWFAFRDAAMKKFVLQWAQDNEVTLEESQ
jgi:hypothetical protein